MNIRQISIIWVINYYLYIQLNITITQSIEISLNMSNIFDIPKIVYLLVRY